jgi:hypothetical protein
MNAKRSVFVCLVSAALVVASTGNAADEPLKMAVVAGYKHDKASTIGARARAILSENHIFSIAGGSRGYCLSVPADQETKARRLLAQAIQSEGLDLNLLRFQRGLYETISADAVLRPPSK